jgi:hypothetical protein
MSERNHVESVHLIQFAYLITINRSLSYIPLYRLLESLGGSEAYEKDPAAYAEGLKSGWPKELPRDSKYVIALCPQL